METNFGCLLELKVILLNSMNRGEKRFKLVREKKHNFFSLGGFSYKIIDSDSSKTTFVISLK